MNLASLGILLPSRRLQKVCKESIFICTLVTVTHLCTFSILVSNVLLLDFKAKRLAEWGECLSEIQKASVSLQGLITTQRGQSNAWLKQMQDKLALSEEALVVSESNLKQSIRESKSS